MAFTPSVESWIDLLQNVAALDVDTVLPPHGDVATRADVRDLADFLKFEFALAKTAIDKGIPVETAVTTLDFSPYKTWLNMSRREHDVRALYELIQTGRRSYFE